MLDENRKAQLLSVVRKMHEGGEDEDTIRRAVGLFKQQYETPEPQGSALGRAAGAFVENLVPENIRHPSQLVDQVSQLPGAVADLARAGDPRLLNPLSFVASDIGQQAVDSAQRQRARGTNVVSSLAAGVPVIGPAIQQVGDNVEEGDYASALGHAGALALPFLAKGASAIGSRIAASPLAESASQLGKVAPKIAYEAGKAGVGAAVESTPIVGPGVKAAFSKGAQLVQEARLKHAAARAAKLGEAAKVEAPVGEVVPFERSPIAEPPVREMTASEIGKLPPKEAVEVLKKARKPRAPKAEATPEAPQGNSAIAAPSAAEISGKDGGVKMGEFIRDRLMKGGTSIGQMNDTLRQLYGYSAPDAAYLIRETRKAYGIDVQDLYKGMGQVAVRK